MKAQLQLMPKNKTQSTLDFVVRWQKVQPVYIDSEHNIIFAPHNQQQAV